MHVCVCVCVRACVCLLCMHGHVHMCLWCVYHYRHQVIKSEQRQFTTWVLTDEGKQVAREGSHEVHVFLAVHPTDGTPQAEVMVRIE